MKGELSTPQALAYGSYSSRRNMAGTLVHVHYLADLGYKKLSLVLVFSVIDIVPTFIELDGHYLFAKDIRYNQDDFYEFMSEYEQLSRFPDFEFRVNYDKKVLADELAIAGQKV